MKVNIPSTHFIAIEDVINGFIIYEPYDECSQLDGPDSMLMKSVVENDGDVDGNKKAFEELIYYLADYLGVDHDNRGNKNLRVSCDRAGEDYEEED